MKEQPTAERKVRRRLKQGRDYHGWAWKAEGWPWSEQPEKSAGLFHWAEPHRPKRRNGKPTEKGKWVRVKFVEVSYE